MNVGFCCIMSSLKEENCATYTKYATQIVIEMSQTPGSILHICETYNE